MFKKIRELFSLDATIKAKKHELESILIDLDFKERLISQIKEEEREKARIEAQSIINDAKSELERINTEISNKDKYISEIEELKAQHDKYSKQVDAQTKKLAKIKDLYKAMNTSIEQFFNADCSINDLKIPDEYIVSAEELAPSVTLKLHCMDIKELRKAFNDNDKLIHQTLNKYEGRYTTKANAAIYKLMVVALEAELQNVLFNLKYTKLDQSIDLIKEIVAKYLSVASDGNQSIAPTLVKFIGEIECLFINAIKIEYEYYVKKERQKEEQAALREQMRQEAEERKILEQQKKQVEKEEEKYKSEIAKVQEQLNSTQDEDKLIQLQNKIKELQGQLDSVEHKKEEIISRQNGQAGYVYVISNLGSFGEDVFKVGMTRRLDPMDRINELGSASVPFQFDVHSFIFSDNAVELEQRLHNILNNNRVNKINMRKEFFRVSLDKLEQLVYDIDPSAEFNRTMLAEQYRQTLSIEEGLSEEAI